jgi:hypothetical protein
MNLELLLVGLHRHLARKPRPSQSGHGAVSIARPVGHASPATARALSATPTRPWGPCVGGALAARDPLSPDRPGGVGLRVHRCPVVGGSHRTIRFPLADEVLTALVLRVVSLEATLEFGDPRDPTEDDGVHAAAGDDLRPDPWVDPDRVSDSDGGGPVRTFRLPPAGPRRRARGCSETAVVGESAREATPRGAVEGTFGPARDAATVRSGHWPTGMRERPGPSRPDRTAFVVSRNCVGRDGTLGGRGEPRPGQSLARTGPCGPRSGWGRRAAPGRRRHRL